MDEIKNRLFEDLCSGLSEVEVRFSENLPHQADEDEHKPDLRIVPSELYEDESDQTGDESGQIAALNDRFRQTQAAQDGEIKGEWIMDDALNDLPPPTKAAIKKKIMAYDDFEGCPLHDRGAFEHVSKSKSYPIVWMIRVFEDQTLQTEAAAPEDASRSYRAMLVTLSDQAGEEE